MTHNEISQQIITTAIKIHRSLGPGLFESVYQRILEYELRKSGLHVVSEKSIPVAWDDIKFDEGFRSDLIVEEKVIIELKSVEKVLPVHKKQLLTYLRLSGLKLGLLINFGDKLLKDGITRIVNGFEE